MKYCALPLIAMIFCSCQNQSEKIDDIEVVDTHIHFYDPSRPGGVAWPPKTDAVLYKAHYPKHFNEVTLHHNIKATVIIEASDHHKDNKWLLDITKNEKDHYTGIVGNLAVGSSHFDKQLEELCADPVHTCIDLLLEVIHLRECVRGFRMAFRESRDADSESPLVPQARRVVELPDEPHQVDRMREMLEGIA